MTSLPTFFALTSAVLFCSPPPPGAAVPSLSLSPPRTRRCSLLSLPPSAAVPRRAAPPPAALRLPDPQDGGAEPVGGRGAVPGGQGAPGLPEAAGVVVLHLRLRHLRGLQWFPAPQHRVCPPQPLRPHHRGLRLPLQAAPGVFRSPLVRGGSPREGVPGGRPLLGRAVLRHRGGGLLPLRPRRPRGLPVRPPGLPSRGARAPNRPGGDGSAGLPVAGELLCLGGRAGRGQGGHVALGGPGAGRGVPAPGGTVPGPGGTPHLGPQHLCGVRLPEPGAVDREPLVRVQGDRLGGPGGPRPPTWGGPRESPRPRRGVRTPRGGLRPARGGLRPARGGLPARLRPGGVRSPPVRGGVRPGSPHIVRQSDVGSSPPAGGAVPKSRPARRRAGAGPGAGPRPPGGGSRGVGGA